MKLKAQSVYLKLLAFCMALLGFAACGDEPDEYGSPTADYKIVGNVVSAADTEQPIENIRVIVQSGEEFVQNNVVYYYGDTIYSDKDGLFVYNKRSHYRNVIKIRFDDIDGEANGEFTGKTDTIRFASSDYKGGDGWYEGKTEKDMGTVKLDSKTTASTSEE